MEENKPDISKSIKDGDELIVFWAKKVVKKIGDGAHILVPKALIGKRIEIHYKKGGKNETKKTS